MAERLSEMRRRISAFAHLNVFICETEEAGDGTVVAVKDVIDVRGTPTTAGSVVLGESPAPADALVISRLRKAGCIVIGKTNLHEWAAGPTSANPHYGPVRNPHDPSRVAGGSSGGSAVAVALGMCDWALGTDTGGSIRIPASLTGVVGFKPTFDLVPTDGLVPLAQSLDTIGPLAASVGEALSALEAMSGAHLIGKGRPPDWDRLRVGFPSGWISDLDEATESVWCQLSEGLPEIAFPARDRFARAILPIMQGEAAANHRQWLEKHRDQYGTDVLAFIEGGLSITLADYEAAKREAERLREECELAMLDWDAIVLPTTACVAPRLDDIDVREPLTRFTRPFNLTGNPAVSIPVPGTANLPVGIQLVGHRGDDAALGRVALALERRLREMHLPR